MSGLGPWPLELAGCGKHCWLPTQLGKGARQPGSDRIGSLAPTECRSGRGIKRGCDHTTTHPLESASVCMSVTHRLQRHDMDMLIAERNNHSLGTNLELSCDNGSKMSPNILSAYFLFLHFLSNLSLPLTPILPILLYFFSYVEHIFMAFSPPILKHFILKNRGGGDLLKYFNEICPILNLSSV